MALGLAFLKLNDTKRASVPPCLKVVLTLFIVLFNAHHII